MKLLAGERGKDQLYWMWLDSSNAEDCRRSSRATRAPPALKDFGRQWPAGSADDFAGVDPLQLRVNRLAAAHSLRRLVYCQLFCLKTGLGGNQEQCDPEVAVRLWDQHTRLGAAMSAEAEGRNFVAPADDLDAKAKFIADAISIDEHARDATAATEGFAQALALSIFDQLDPEVLLSQIREDYVAKLTEVLAGMRQAGGELHIIRAIESAEVTVAPGDQYDQIEDGLASLLANFTMFARLSDTLATVTGETSGPVAVGTPVNFDGVEWYPTVVLFLGN